MKVIGIGLNKTGTSTLKTCMKTWGYKHMTFDLDAFNAYREKDFDYLRQITDAHDSFENWPWALMYQRLYDWYPDAKFILTIRKNPQTWFKSLSRHGKSLGPLTDYEIYIYGYANPNENKQAHIDYYCRHNREVAEFFQDKPGKLLTVCWENGDGWNELSEFLNLKQPDVDFPHSNKTPSMLKKMETKYRPILGRYKQKILEPISKCLRSLIRR